MIKKLSFYYRIYYGGRKFIIETLLISFFFLIEPYTPFGQIFSKLNISVKNSDFLILVYISIEEIYSATRICNNFKDIQKLIIQNFYFLKNFLHNTYKSMEKKRVSSLSLTIYRLDSVRSEFAYNGKLFI